MQRSSSKRESDVLCKQFSLAGESGKVQSDKAERNGAEGLERDLIMKGL